MGSDKEKYSTITIEDEEELEAKSIFSKTLEIPRIILTKNRRKKKNSDNFEKAIRYTPSPDEGLNSLQIEERQTNNLVNKQTKSLSKSYLQIIISNVFTFFNILLVTIACFLLAVGAIGDCFFVVIMLANTLIGIIQEIKAKQKVDQLSLMSIPEIKVKRDALKMKIPADKLVLDDIYYLKTGNEVPCDSYIVRGSIEVNESSLTGEALPIKKQVDDYLLAGSFIVSGTCMCRVDRIGEHNYISQLQNKARKVKKAKSILLTSLNKIIMYISGIIIPLGCLLAWNNYTLTSDITETIKKTGASLVSMVPSGLFLLLSTTLTVAVLALAKRKTMVQDSYAIESLARCDVICLDKTGTITDGTMRLEKEIKLTDKRIDIKKLMGSFVSAFQDDKNVTMEALTKAYPETKTHKIKVVLPFSSSRKLSAVEFEKTGTFVLGAPEFITKDKKVLSRSEEFAKEGFRVLLLAYTNEPLSEQSTFFKVEPYALLVLSDHIRDEAYDTIKWFNENNMEVKIISGDNPQTVSQIALKAGVLHGDRYISLEGLSNDEVSTFANQYTVFGRVSPEQKAVLIKALKNNNRTVAMTGDGVNDILAMKQANCSIAMASGSDAARNASHLVLMDSNFASMPKVVEQGRKVINNIQKTASLYLMKTTYAILFALITLVSWAFGLGFVQPFNARHLYILEFVVIGIPSFIFALQSNKSLIKGTFMKTVFSKAIPYGILMLLSVVSVMLMTHNDFFEVNSNNVMVTMACLSISITGFIALFFTSLPFSLYRIGTFLLMFGIAAIYVFLVPSGFNGIYIEELSSFNWVTLGILTLIIFIVALIIYIVRYLLIKKGEKNEN